MNALRILLRFTSGAIAGLFASRGGAWWIAAVLYLLITIAPVPPRGTRLAFGATILFTLVVAAVAAYLALQRERYALWALLGCYGFLQAVREKLAASAPRRQQRPGG